MTKEEFSALTLEAKCKAAGEDQELLDIIIRDHIMPDLSEVSDFADVGDKFESSIDGVKYVIDWDQVTEAEIIYDEFAWPTVACRVNGLNEIFPQTARDLPHHQRVVVLALMLSRWIEAGLL